MQAARRGDCSLPHRFGSAPPGWRREELAGDDTGGFYQLIHFRRTCRELERSQLCPGGVIGYLFIQQVKSSILQRLIPSSDNLLSISLSSSDGILRNTPSAYQSVTLLVFSRRSGRLSGRLRGEDIIR